MPWNADVKGNRGSIPDSGLYSAPIRVHTQIMRVRSLRPSGALLAAAVMVVGCGSTAASGALSEDQVLHQVANLACQRMEHCGLTSSQMAFTVTPTAGPRGTVVTLTVSGCIDPSGKRHQIAFQSGSAVVAIAAVKHGTSLTATYRVDGAAGAGGRFTATCLDTYVTRDFAASR